MNKWVDVKTEGLPQEQIPCLVVWSGRVQYVSYFLFLDEWLASHDEDVEPLPANDVTHWMPLPSPPTV